MKNSIFKVIDSKGRIYLPKDLRNKLNIDLGDIVKISFNNNSIFVKKVDLIEVGDKSPEAVQEYVKSVIRNMDKQKCISLLDEIINQLKEE